MRGLAFLLATSFLLVLPACDSQPNERSEYQLLQSLDTLRIDPRDGEFRVSLADLFESSGSDPLVYQTRVLDGTAVDVRIESDQLVITPLQEGEAKITVGIAHSDGAGAFTRPTVIVKNPCPAEVPAGAVDLFPIGAEETWTFSLSEVRFDDASQTTGAYTLGQAHLTVESASECTDDAITYRIREIRTDSISAISDGRPTDDYGPVRTMEHVYEWTVRDSTITTDALDLSEARFVIPPPPIGREVPRWTSPSNLFSNRVEVLTSSPFTEYRAYVWLEKDTGPTWYRWMTAQSTPNALARGLWRRQTTTRSL